MGSCKHVCDYGLRNLGVTKKYKTSASGRTSRPEIHVFLYEIDLELFLIYNGEVLKFF